MLINSCVRFQTEPAPHSNFWGAGVSSPDFTYHVSFQKKQKTKVGSKEESRWRCSQKPLSYWSMCTHIPLNSFSGLVRSYLSHYSSFPRAPPTGLFANMLINTNGGNLSVPGMSLGYREREFHIQLEVSEWVIMMNTGSLWFIQTSPLFLPVVRPHFPNRLTRIIVREVVFRIHSGHLRGDGKQRKRVPHEIQLLWQLTRVWPFSSGVLPLDVVPTHTHCCSVFEYCVCVCHKVKQHNDTGPITLGI